ncbi:methylmalonyl-CoA mutase family protein [Rhabdobacter roseus]|nr:methylmalonyl-CoA mutase family protein [Rhabdobacter roseus]
MTKESWQQQVRTDLKGTSYESLQQVVGGGAALEPYYTAAELDEPRAREVRAAQRSQPGWLNQPLVRFTTSPDTNWQLLEALDRGADALWLDLGTTSLLATEVPKTLHKIRLTDVPIIFETSGILPADLVTELTRNAPYYLKGGIAADPLAQWMQRGTSYELCLASVGEAMTATKAMREFRTCAVGSQVFHNAGADPVQELAFTLALATAYLDALTEAGVPPLLAVNRLFFSISVGTSYLTEIAKLRALRYLYRRISRAYQLPDALCRTHVHARTSTLYETTSLPPNNLLRATSEAMSAVVGGCDALSVRPFDSTLGEPTAFSSRLARNVSLVLKEEGYLGFVADPAAGSYYLETLTLQLADAAWALFLDVEERGGLIKAFEQNFIQDKIQKAWEEKQAAYAQGRVLVGVNKYQAEEPGGTYQQVPSSEKNTSSEVLPFDLLPDRRLETYLLNQD